VQNQAVYSSPNEVKVDRTLPTGTISGTPVGPVGGTIVPLTGTSTDLESGVQKVDLTFTGPASGAVCNNPPTPTAWSCAWDTTVGVPDGLYTLTLTITDLAGNTNATTRTIVVDNNPPTTGFNSFVELTNPQYMWSAPATTTMFFNPAFTGSFMVKADAADGGAGVDRVDFPALGAGWTPAGSSDTTGPSPYDTSYSWTAGAASPGGPNIFTAFDLVGNSATAAFTVTADAVPPAGGNVNTPNIITNGASATITDAPGTDLVTGIGHSQMQRKTGTYSGGTCSAYGAFSDIGAPNPGVSFADATIADGQCYQYQFKVWDNVENLVIYNDPDEVKVDRTNPTGLVDPSPAGPISGHPDDLWHQCRRSERRAEGRHHLQRPRHRRDLQRATHPDNLEL